METHDFDAPHLIQLFQPPLTMAPCDTTEFTPSIRGRILALCKEGYTYQQIANKGLRLSSCCLQNHEKRQNPAHPKSLPQPGHPTAVDERTQQAIL